MTHNAFSLLKRAWYGYKQFLLCNYSNFWYKGLSSTILEVMAHYQGSWAYFLMGVMDFCLYKHNPLVLLKKKSHSSLSLLFFKP